MRITHLDLPRAFTFTVKEYQVEVAAALAGADHHYHQFDANPIFWQWLTTLPTRGGVADCWSGLLNCASGAAIDRAARGLNEQLASVAGHYQIAMGFHGIALPRAAANATAEMRHLIHRHHGREFFARFFSHLETQTGFAEADFVSLGVDSQTGIFWVLNLATWLRASGWKGHLSIGRHNHENFSLLHNLDQLARNRVLFDFVDSIVLYEEEMADGLRSLSDAIAARDERKIRNAAWRSASGRIERNAPDANAREIIRHAPPSYSVPEEYFAAVPVPRDQLVYAMPMTRNKCFYRRCSFCAQIAKHVSDVAYAATAEVSRSLAAVSELGHHGIHAVNFTDEAMRPADVRRFVAGVRERNLPIRWVGRMIATGDPDRELVQEMAGAGCVEILFGLESFDPDTAAALGKISGKHESPDTAIALVQTMADAGIFTILSLITGSPVTSDDSVAIDRRALEALARRNRKVAVIINEFALFHSSRMFRQPAKFGIGAIDEWQPQNDLQIQFGWTPACNRAPARITDHDDWRRLKLGLSEPAYQAARARYADADLETIHFLDYCSLGLYHRIEHGSTMIDECFRPAMTARPTRMRRPASWKHDASVAVEEGNAAPRSPRPRRARADVCRRSPEVGRERPPHLAASAGLIETENL
jgi:hypothetical protein